MKRILFLPSFLRQFHKQPELIQELFLEREVLFRNDPFHPLLKTHKLKGRLNDYWSFWLNYDYRVMFRFQNADTIELYQIGDHKIYD